MPEPQPLPRPPVAQGLCLWGLGRPRPSSRQAPWAPQGDTQGLGGLSVHGPQRHRPFAGDKQVQGAGQASLRGLL